MRFSNLAFTGSINISGSLVLPNGTANLRPSNALTGSLFVETSASGSNLLVYNGQSGSGWEIAGIQTEPQLYIPPPNGDIEYLVVAGGASGGSNGGGGGAGGLLSSSLSSIASGSSITVTVGAGGSNSVSYQDRGNDGSNSTLASAAGTSFTTVTSIGGGGGASNDSPTGRDGGSGGGAGTTPSGGGHSGGSGTAGQGNRGGNTSANGHPYVGAGGGGAGAQGTDVSTTPGAGGAGKQSSITGTSTYYAGGGGGTGGTQGATGGAGGSGGGGQGGVGSSGQAGFAADVNTGGGGGSSGDAGAVGAGGSGIVILAYDSGSITATGGVAKSRSDGHVSHTFNSSGTLTVGGTSDFTVLNGDNFGFLQWDGDNANPRSVTGLGFDPGMVWVKNTVSSGENWALGDVIRTTGKILYPNLNLAQTSGEYITPITDGVKITTGNNNYSSNSYTAWCWKAGGTGVTNNGGDVTSTVSANTAAGFSIVRNTGTADYSQTLGHGLSAAPELIIQKTISSAVDWYVLFNIDGTGSWDWGKLNSSIAFTADIHSFSTNATTIKNWGWNGYDMINYCFHSVPGYSKISTYEGNQSAGNSVNVGFQPRFVVIKGVDGVENWIVHSAVSGMNGTNHIRWNSSGALDNGANEAISFTSTGFSITTAGATQINTSGRTYLYWAIA